MDLDNSIWATLKGGYNIPYNASRPLKKLRDAVKPPESQAVFKELWDNLHHQGDVGLASYLAIPQLVTICMDKGSFDWNYTGLCVLIENCRLNKHNPELPDEYQAIYFDSLAKFEKYLLLNFKNIPDREGLRLALSLFATLNGQPELGKAIEILDDDELAKFLKAYKDNGI